MFVMLLILIWNKKNEFPRNFSALQGISSKEKYGESATSNLFLKKFMSGSLLALFKLWWKSNRSKTFSWELAEFSSWIFARHYSGFIYERFRFYGKISMKTCCFLYFLFVTISIIDQDSIHTIFSLSSFMVFQFSCLISVSLEWSSLILMLVPLVSGFLKEPFVCLPNLRTWSLLFFFCCSAYYLLYILFSL